MRDAFYIEIFTSYQCCDDRKGFKDNLENSLMFIILFSVLDKFKIYHNCEGIDDKYISMVTNLDVRRA